MSTRRLMKNKIIEHFFLISRLFFCWLLLLLSLSSPLPESSSLLFYIILYREEVFSRYKYNIFLPLPIAFSCHFHENYYILLLLLLLHGCCCCAMYFITMVWSIAAAFNRLHFLHRSFLLYAYVSVRQVLLLLLAT